MLRKLTIVVGALAAFGVQAETVTVDAAAGATVTDEQRTGTIDLSVNTGSGSTGTVILNGANDYVGTTTLGGGTLEAPILAPSNTASSLGSSGEFIFQGGTFHYSGTEAATFDRAVTFGASAACTIQNDGDLKLTGKWTYAVKKSFTKTGAGTLNLTKANKFYTSNVNEGTLALTAGSTTFGEDLTILGTAYSADNAWTCLRVTGGTHTLSESKHLVIGDNTSKVNYYADFIMTGGTLNIGGTLKLADAVKEKYSAHVRVDISGGQVNVDRYFSVSGDTKYRTASHKKYVDITIRDTGSVLMRNDDGKDTFRFYVAGSNDCVTLTVKDGGTFKVPAIVRNTKGASSPTILFDGGNIIWCETTNVFTHASGYELGKSVSIGSKGVSFTGSSATQVYQYDASLVASNTVADAEAKGVSFAKGTYVLMVANSYAGPTVIDSDATVVAQVVGAIPANSALTVKGTLALIKDVPLALDDVPTGTGAIRLYTDATRAALVSDAGTYPVLNVPLAQKDALQKFAYGLSAQNGGYFSVTDDGSTTATLNLVLGSSLTQPSSLALEGTNDASVVVFACTGELEEEGGVTYFKPNQPARLRASESTGGLYLSGWRDETTQDFYWGNDVPVTPTNRTVYTAVYGSAWFYDDTAKQISNGIWQFGAYTSSGLIVVTNLTSVSTADGVLNFATPITNADGSAYTITQLGNATRPSYAPFYSATLEKKLTLKRLYLPATLTMIGRSAFGNCSNLTGRVTTPTGCATVNEDAFNSCTRLTSLGLPNVTTIGEGAFYRCKGLTSLNLPSVTVIGQTSFLSCSKLTSLDLPNVTSIGNSAFNGCAGLTDINLMSVTNVGYRAFYNVPATNYVFGTARVYFNDLESTKGNGNQTFYLADSDVVRHFYFPGLAPDMPEKTDVTPAGTTGYQMFGNSAQNKKVILHGSWRIDPEGWKKILTEVGQATPEGETTPTLEAGDRKVKGQVKWRYDDSHTYYAWLVDTKMPDEPKVANGMMILFR